VHVIKSFHESILATATSENSSAPPLVDVITAKPAPSSISLTLPGETAAWYESTIYARVDGYVGKWSADIGDHVRKGQVLAVIETPDLDAQLAAAQAKLKAAQATVVARRADANFAKTTYARWRDAPKGVVSEQEREAKKAAYASGVAQLNEAQAQVNLDQADVNRYLTLTRFKQVIAPYTGRIVERKIDIGNLVTAGSTSSTTSLYRMVQDDPIRIFVDVPQDAAGDMKVKTPVQISAGHNGQIFHGKITRTANAINQQTRTLKVEADIPNSHQALVAGMYVDVSFKIPTEGLIEVPAAALVFRSKGPQVAVVGKDNRVAFRPVTIVRDNGNVVEVGSGIAAGDTIVLNISSQVTEGETVAISEPKGNTTNVSEAKP
jgi:RND family efflux transporter MFP subunit